MRTFVLLLALLPVAPAQSLAWDVPHRGAIVFARTTQKFAVSAPPRLRGERVLAAAADGGHEWRHLSCAPGKAPAGFEQPGFDDSGWTPGRGEFGTEVGKDARQRTAWPTQQLCLRTRFDWSRRNKPRALVFTIDHDDGVKVWWNGRLVVDDGGHGRGRQYLVIGQALDAFTKGDNLFAVQCTDTGGARYCDVALDLLGALPGGTRNADDLARLLADDRATASRVHGELFGGYRPPALLLQGELDASGSSVARPPGDLRDLGWFVATDLRSGVTGGSLQVDAARMYRLADLVVKGKAGPVGPDGWQDLDTTVRSLPEPALGGDSKRFVDQHVRPHQWYGVDGKLRIRRRIELQGGKARVVEFRTEFTARLLRGKDWKEHAADLEQVEHWRLDSIRDNQDAAFRAMVVDALQRGTARLREQLRDVGGPDLKEQPADGGDSYHSGRLALGLLALVKGGVAKDDEVVQRGYEALRKRPLIDTYSLGNALMALEALYAPNNEFGDLKAGSIDRPRRRSPTAEDQALMARWTNQLLQNVDTRVDPAYVLRFNYTRGERFDNSVNQYGLLGLYSAHLCGVPIAATVWEAAANHLLATQSPPLGKLDLDLIDYRTFARLQADPDGKRTVVRLPVRAAGWSYHEGKANGEIAPLWGSMTCAGITGLAICQAALLDQPGLKRNRLHADANGARNAGFAWLAQNLDVRCHPGAVVRQQHWFYYYLYGLERAALLSGVALIQDRDWYFEGAMVLVRSQHPDGNWPGELHWDRDIERNAMAILFLKQSTLPVLTGQ